MSSSGPQFRAAVANNAGVESLDQNSLYAHSYSRLSSSLGSEMSLPQSARPSGWPSSVSNLPRWTLPPPSKLTPLCDLLVPSERTSRRSVPRKRVSLICCVITVNPPIPRQRRFQSRAPGQTNELWVASWKVLAPPSGDGAQDPASCTVTLYESCARDWGGVVRRGDVVLLQGESGRHVISGLWVRWSPSCDYRKAKAYARTAAKRASGAPFGFGDCPPTCVPRDTSVLACDPTSAKDPANASCRCRISACESDVRPPS